MVDLSDLAYENCDRLNVAPRREPEFRSVCSRHTSVRYETDLAPETDEFLKSFGLRGVVRSVRWLLSRVLLNLRVIADAGVGSICSTEAFRYTSLDTASSKSTSSACCEHIAE